MISKNLYQQTNTQHGQAMTELNIVAAAVLVPLFLLVPIMGKYIDIKHTTVQSARYMAWERTAFYPTTTEMPDDANQVALPQKTQALLEKETLTRFFSSTQDPIVSTNNNGPALNNLWRDHSGNALIETSTLTGAYLLSTVDRRKASTAITVIDAVTSTLQAPLDLFMDGANWVASQVNNLSALGGIEVFDQNALNSVDGSIPFLPDEEFPKENYYSYSVSYDLAKIDSRLLGEAQVTQPNIQINAQSALLTETWAAQDLTMFQKRTERRVPSKKLQAFMKPLQVLASTPLPIPAMVDVGFSATIPLFIVDIELSARYHNGIDPFAFAPELGPTKFIPGIVNTDIIPGNRDEPGCRFGECSYNQTTTPPGGPLGIILDLIP